MTDATDALFSLSGGAPMAGLLRPKLAAAAARGVYLGTSSWKYPGWLGQLYDEQRYLHRGKFSESRFDDHCLAEYALTFPTVCVDAGYYAFPKKESLERMAAMVPAGFLFSYKVTDEITARKFPRLPRYGARAGARNENFLNAELFMENFLGPCSAIRPNIGILMFEFSKFHAGDFSKGRDFVELLDGFLERLPRGWDYGVEIRNDTFLQPAYFETLARHGVAHVCNNWTAMPPVGAQLDLLDANGSAPLRAARFLLAPGRPYEEAVAKFSPYNKVQETNEPAREAGARIISQGLGKAAKSLVYVNNRLEGNALGTVLGMLARAGL